MKGTGLLGSEVTARVHSFQSGDITDIPVVTTDPVMKMVALQVSFAEWGS